MPKTGLLALVGVVAVCTSLLAGQTAPIAAAAAKQRIGQRVVVEDDVAQVSREPQSGFTYLNFGGEFPRHLFRVVIPTAVEMNFATRPTIGSRVRVDGLVREGLLGIPEIVCGEPSQLQVVQSTTALSGGVFGMAGSPTPTATPAAKKCCRVCSSGKPCGDSCISKTATCRQPPGCAC
jgi:hypothetical protein